MTINEIKEIFETEKVHISKIKKGDSVIFEGEILTADEPVHDNFFGWTFRGVNSRFFNHYITRVILNSAGCWTIRSK